MNREQLNQIRRQAGVAQDFSAPTEKELLEAAGHGDYSGAGATTGGPDNHVHPKVSDSELDYEGDYENGDEDKDEDHDEDHDEAPSFAKGDMVKHNDEDFIVVLASDENVVIAPVGHESDMETIKIVSAGELQAADGDEEMPDSDDDMSDEEGDMDDENGDDRELSDEEMDGEDLDKEEDNEYEEDTMESHGRKRDTKVTPSLSRKDQQRNEKALRSKERQQGKKEAMNESHFKKGDHVMHNGKKCVVKVPDGKADFIGIVPADDQDAKVDMVKHSDLKLIKESMHHHSDDNYETFADDERQPVNVSANYPTVWDDPDFDEDPEDHEMANDDEKIHVPAKILSDYKKVITACEKEAAKAEKRDDDQRMHDYADTAKAHKIVHYYLAWKTIEGLKRAQLLSRRMANVSLALMPDHVWKFIIDGGSKRSLKDYMNDVKGMPIEGPRNELD